jgi:hypothetical protein
MTALEELIEEKELLTEQFKELSEQFDSLDDVDYEEAYDAMLDDTYGDIDVCGYSYSASYALKELDPTAYRVGLSDFESSLLDDSRDEIKEQLDYIYERILEIDDEIEELEKDDDNECEL